MTYFSDICTEEELKEQYRKLLNKNDYCNPDKSSLIAEIREEYEKKLFEVRYTDAHQITDKAYSTKEYTGLILEEKRYINRVLKKIVTTNKARFLLIKEQLTGDDYIELYNRFNRVVFAAESETISKNYYNICRQIEQATEYLAKDKEECKVLMTRIKAMMGKHVQQTLATYGEKYIDDIDMQQIYAMYHIADRGDEDKSHQDAPQSVPQEQPSENDALEQGFYTKVAYFIIFFFVVMAIILKDIMLLMFALPFVLWCVFIKVWDVLVVKPFEDGEQEESKLFADKKADIYSKAKEVEKKQI